jgi:hypothetical protein
VKTFDSYVVYVGIKYVFIVSNGWNADIVVRQSSRALSLSAAFFIDVLQGPSIYNY